MSHIFIYAGWKNTIFALDLREKKYCYSLKGYYVSSEPWLKMCYPYCNVIEKIISKHLYEKVKQYDYTQSQWTQNAVE